MVLSENLQFFRARHSLTQEQLAAQLDVSRQSVSKWESGLSYPEMDTLLKLCDLFDIDLDTLLRGNAEKACAEDTAGYDSFMNRHIQKVAGSVAGLILSFALCSALYALGLPQYLYVTLFWFIVGVCVVILVASGIQYDMFRRRNPVITDFYTTKQKDTFAQTYVWHIAGGVGGILFAFAMAALGNLLLPKSSFDSGAMIGAGFLFIVAISVYALISGGMLHDKYDIEKYNLENTPEYQAKERNIQPINGIIMLIATAIFLWLGLSKNAWPWCWVVYLPASGLCTVIKLVIGIKK